jgi:mRNA interferase YafQ
MLDAGGAGSPRTRCSKIWESEPLRNPIDGARFRRDVKLAGKRGKNMVKLREVIFLLVEGEALPSRYKDHTLGGEWRSFRDCHIEPDWLLIYKIVGDDLYLVRTGTHSDLF